MTDPMSARSLLTAIEFDRAAEVLEIFKTSDDPDILADAMEDAAQGGELTHAVIFRLVMEIRGGNQMTGMELANQSPHAGSLILPPGVRT